MIDRRRLIMGGLMLAAAPRMAWSAPTPPSNRIGFDVMREGSKLGTHVLTFDKPGNDLTVQVAVDLSYDMGPVSLFKYTHRATERWKGDQFVSIESKTDDDGKDFQVSGMRDANGIAVKGNKIDSYVAPANTLPATHWNRDQLKGPWINTQDGKLLKPVVTDQGVESIALTDGSKVNANHYKITGDAKLDMWYDDKIGWAGLLFVIDDTPIQYVRQA